MTDIAELAFRVDTRDLARAANHLETLEQIATASERRFQALQRSLYQTASALREIMREAEKLERMARIDIDVRLNAQSVHRELSDLRSRLGGGVLTLDINADLTRVTSEIASLRRSGGVNVNVTATADTSRAIAEIDSLKKAASDVTMNITAHTDTGRALADLHSLRNQAGQIRLDIDVNVSGSATSAELNNVRTTVLSLNQAVLAGTRYLRDYNNELDRIRGSAGDAADAIRRAADEQERLRRAGGGFGGGNSETGWRRHARSVLDTANAYSGLAVRLLAAKSAIAVLTAAAAGAIPVLGQMAAAAGAVFGTALATANVAAMSKELSKLTETTGASAEGLQKWRLAARFEGIDAALNEFGDMGKVFTDLSSQIDKLGTESGKDFSEGLKLIGLSAKQIKEMKPEEALLAIGDAIAKSNMSTRDKTAFLGAISDDAAKLLPLLEKAGQKFNEISDYASKVGAIQSDAQLAAAKEANTQLSYFKVGLEGVQTQLAAVGNRVINTLGPNIKKLFVDAKAPLDDWALAVDIVLTKFKHDLDSTGSWGTAFARMFEGMYPTLYQFLSSAGKFGKGYGEAFVTPMLDALKRGYAGISEALGNAGGAESLGKGLGEAMLPVIAIVDTIIASIKLLINNWDALKAVAAVTPVGLIAANWDSVVAVFESVGNGIRGVGEAFGLLNPATTANASGVQIFVAALGALLVSGAASRLVLGAIGATFSTLSFALAPLGAVLGIVATGLKAVALAAVANPIGALIAVIVGGAALIFTNWEKVGAFFDNLWAGVKDSASGLIDWWNNTTPKEKVLDIKAATVDVVKEKYTQFVGWLNNTTPQQKILDIKTTAIDLAKTAAEGFKNWWDGSTLKEWASSIGVTNIDTAKEKASQFSAWWKETTLAEKALAIATPHIAVARIAAEGFFSWWDKSTLKEISPPIVLNTVEKARTNLVSFFVWWDGSTLTEKVADIKTTALNVARSAAESFKGWWDSWTLKQVVADVSAEVLIFAWDKSRQFASWWDSWNLKEIALTASSAILEKAFGVAKTLGGWWDEWKLLTKDLKADASLVEKAEAIARKFADWWNNLSLKSIIPDIKMPDIAGFGAKLGAKMRSIGSDVIDGLAQGMARASSHVKAAEQAANKIPLVFRSALDTHSPSKVTEKIGFDVVAGLAVGIAGNKSAVNAAANLSVAVTNEFSRMADDINRIGQALTDGLFSGNWKQAGKDILAQLKGTFVDPLKKSLSDAIAQGLAGGANGGFLGSIAKLLNFDGIKGALSGVGSSIGGLFSGIASSAANGFAGIGSAISGGLSGIMGSFGTLVSAIPGWGWALAGIAGLAKLFGGPSDPKLRFTQGATDGQAMLGQGGHAGNAHNYQTVFGKIGATASSDKIGREKDFVPKFHEMMQAMQQLDAMIAKTLPNSIGKITEALTGLESSGFNTAEMMKQRYVTVAQSLSTELQTALANGGDLTKMTAEEIVGRFQLLAQVAESGLIPSLQSLGLNLGTTHEGALAAALGLVDLMGGIDKVKAATDFYYQQFFSDKEREAAALKAAKTDVDAFNKSLGLTGSAAIDTHAEFRKYVQSLDLTTEAGRKAYAEAMKYAQSIDAVADANKAATQAQNELIASLRGSLQGIRDSFKDSITRINEDLMSQEELQKKYMNEAQKWAEKLKTESDPAKIADISAKLNEAVGKVWGTMTDEQKAANADYLKNLLTAAQADAERGLKNAISQAQQMREAISTLQRPANEMSNAASKMMSAAAKMPTDINITVTSEGVDVDKLPKFAKGGITSGVSIAGEAGAEAVVPLPDGRSIPVSMKINNAATLSTAADTATKAATTTTTATTTKISDEALKAYKDAIKSAQDYAYELKYGSDALRERKLLEEGWTQQMVDNLRTIEKSNDAAKKAAEIKSSYESAMKAANDQLFALKNGEEALRRKTLAEEGWTDAMINNLLKIEDANKAAEKSKQIAEDYKAALKSAEDYAYQLQFGEEALRRKTLAEEGWTEQMINNLLKIEDANKAAEKAAQIKNDYDAAMKAAQDYAYELKYGSEALKRRTLLEQGWTEQMINNLFALEKANEEARKAAEANQNAIDAMNKQRESEIETYERLQAAAKSMRQTLDELFYNAELTLASPFERLEAARKKVDDLSAKAAHDPVSAEALSAAVTDALKLSREYNASSQAYVDDYKRMTGLLAQVAEKIEKMRDPRNNGSSGPLRLSNGMELVPGMRDDGTWEWDGSHAAGLSYVPFDGYIAQLHRGEMVVPANAANALRNLNNMDQQISMTPNVIDARPVFNNRHTERDDAQKQELAELKEQLKKANDKLERLASAVESGNAQKVQADKRKLALAEETRDSIHSGNRIADRKQVARGLK